MFIGSYRLLSQASKIAAVNFVDVLSFAPFSYIGTHGSSSSSRYNCRTLLDLLHRFSRSDSTRLSSDGHAGQIRAFHRGQNMSRTQQQLIVSLKPKEIGFSTQRLLHTAASPQPRLLQTAASLQRHSKYLNKHSNIRPTNIFHF
ncbi:MAG: hypothetical protein DMF61_21355 [Blastocatellia bacterium AA13]|nr:MAG: hypothetical protein DMF61_21355 [Blastocatellia bacterium AA13]